MAITRKASAQWRGDIKQGKGNISTDSGALSQSPFGFNTRFEDQPGTNPEELIGAAHAGCFSMALSLNLTEANYVAERIDTQAAVNLEQVEGGFAITGIHLTVTAVVPELEQAQFLELAEKTKQGCPVSKVLNAEITLDAQLES